MEIVAENIDAQLTNKDERPVLLKKRINGPAKGKPQLMQPERYEPIHLQVVNAHHTQNFAEYDNSTEFLSTVQRKDHF